MSNETLITLIGNLTSDPELRYTQNGKAVANVTIASGERRFDRTTNEYVDGDTLFMRVAIWGEYGEHAAASLTKGTRVIATGRLKQRHYETADSAGVMQKRTSTELVIDDIGPALKFATAAVHRITSQTDPHDSYPAPAAAGSFLPADSAAALV